MKRIRKSIYVMSKFPCGYCHNKTHRGYVSVKALKDHKCLAKQCLFFEKFEEHSYWAMKEKIKENRKNKKLLRGY